MSPVTLGPNLTSAPAATWQVGERYSAVGTVINTTVPILDEMRGAPIFVPRTVNIDEIRLDVTVAGGAGSVLRFGLYNALPTLFPGTLIVDFGTVAATSVGQKAIAISRSVPAGWLFLAVVAQVGTVPTLRGVGAVPAMPQPAGIAGYTRAAFSDYGTSGALPATWGTPDRDAGDFPRLEIRVSA